MKADAITIGGMMFELGELDSLPVAFDEKLWPGTVDHVTVHADERYCQELCANSFAGSG